MPQSIKNGMLDKRIAPGKAWLNRMELDAKRDRYMMGIAGRLAIEYSKDEDSYYIVKPEEVKWIKRLFDWFNDEDLETKKFALELEEITI